MSLQCTNTHMHVYSHLNAPNLLGAAGAFYRDQVTGGGGLQVRSQLPSSVPAEGQHRIWLLRVT